MVSHHLAIFDNYWFSSSGDVKHLTCHVNLQNHDHVIEGSSNFMSWSFSLCITTLLSLVVIGIVIVEIFLVCHLIKQDHVMKGSCDFMDGSLSW